MKSKANDFSTNNYLKVDSLIPDNIVKLFNYYSSFQEKYDYSPEVGDDIQVANSHSRYADYFAEALLLLLKDKVEKQINEKLLPSYSYFRVYNKGNDLKPHLDREACEVSVTVSFGENIWPFYIINAFKYDDKKVREVRLQKGDGLIYAGTKVVHWREPLEYEKHTQIFLHYVRQNGLYTNFKYDKREQIGEPAHI